MGAKEDQKLIKVHPWHQLPHPPPPPLQYLPPDPTKETKYHIKKSERLQMPTTKSFTYDCTKLQSTTIP